MQPEGIIHSMTDLASETMSDGIAGDDHGPAERAFLMSDTPGHTRGSLMLFVT
jgi:hypothetical protein